jgi:3-isopropylmalate dehydratase, large subunit
MKAKALFDKLWDSHAIVARDDGATLLWVDRHYFHEGSHHAFARLAASNLRVAEPKLSFGVADHYVPTRGRQGPIADATIARMVATLESNARQHGARLFGLEDPNRGITHVIGPEQGLTLPGMLVVCGDSHTSTHGALGAYAFGIGATEVAHVLATQTIWQKKPRRMRIVFSGKAMPGVSAKDMALNWIARLGSDGARGYAVEYAGQAISDLSVEGRLSLCNMSIEGGAKCGLVAPDETTYRWLKGRPHAPREWDRAVEVWNGLASDDDAVFDREVVFDMSEIAPIVTWGVVPEDALPINASVPDPDRIADPSRAEHARGALDYMGLRPGQSLQTVPIDYVFIGSCTNSRIEDLRAAAAVLAGRRSRVPGIVSPGSTQVKTRAEQEGLDRIFVEAGLEWVESGCSMCVGMNGDVLRPGMRCASTTNRNFRGRQGPGARTHLMSPAMVAAAAVSGHLADVRPLLAGRSL